MTIESRLTDVFIDGLNFYYGAVKDTPYKWLDFRKLAENVLPEHNIGRVFYFTAPVQARPPDNSQPVRQDALLRALSTVTDLEIHLGAFRTYKVLMPPAETQLEDHGYLRVLRVEEKQTDVNLATYLVARAAEAQFEQAAVISNDADFVGAIKYVRDKIGLPVIALNPNVVRRRRINNEIKQAATYVRNITERHLADSQFPHSLTDQHGIITKPAIW